MSCFLHQSRRPNELFKTFSPIDLRVPINWYYQILPEIFIWFSFGIWPCQFQFFFAIYSEYCSNHTDYFNINCTFITRQLNGSNFCIDCRYHGVQICIHHKLDTCCSSLIFIPKSQSVIVKFTNLWRTPKKYIKNILIFLNCLFKSLT